MDAIELKFDPVQWEKVRQRLRRPFWDRSVTKMVRTLTEDMEKVAKHEAYPHPGQDTGSIRDSIRSHMVDSWHGEIFSNKVEVKYVEFGRPPGGRMPPVDKIEEWAARHGMPGAGYMIARKIALRGTKGLQMFRKAYDYGRMMTNSRVSAAARDIEQLWRF